jgi:hypothetical protein
MACELIADCGSDQVRSVRIKSLLNQQINLPQVDDAKVDRHFLRVAATILQFNYGHPNLLETAKHPHTIYIPSNWILTYDIRREVQISARGGHCSFKSAGSADFIAFAGGNAAAMSLLDALVASDLVSYPSPEAHR